MRLVEIEGMKREASLIQRIYDSGGWGLRLSSGLVFAF